MAKRKGLTCVLFREVPEGTHYRKDSYSWVTSSTAADYIEDGYGVEYNPYKQQVETVLTMDNTKDEILDYLESEGVEHTKSSTKSELLELI